MVPPLPWEGARVNHCYGNVRAMIQQQGGEMCYGWALADFGPHRLSRRSQNPPPLFRRWVNHVVWRDTAGQLWEVTPGKFVINHTQSKFIATEFIPHPEATFETVAGGLVGQHCRYMPVRPEGVLVADYLNQAQRSSSRRDLMRWLKQALAALADAGFQPREWKVEAFGDRVGSIWLIAE
jgi:hypothetical protein